MIQTIEIENVRIAVCPIEDSGRMLRRQTERLAVERLVTHLCGPEASLSHNPDGAPVIKGFHVSVSHSRRLAAVAVSTHSPIGIDIEENREEMLRRVAPKYISESECAYVTDLLRAWTSKEAVYKAAGVRNLSILHGITIHPGMAEATAAGTLYTLHHRNLGPTLLTLASPSSVSL